MRVHPATSVICSMMRNCIVILFVMVCGALAAQGQKVMSTAEYIDTYKSIAQLEMERYGIPASIKLAQGILESGSGNSPLAKNARNHFGIKCKKDWTGKTYIQDDDTKDECFRSYETVLASYEDHSQFLKNSARYAELFTYDITDYKAWAHGLKKAGYATNPQYAHLLIKTIEENRLYEFDKKGPATEVMQIANEGKPAPKPSALPKGGTRDIEDFELQTGKKHEVHLRNNVKFVVARTGDTYEKLIEELNLMPWELYKYNDLKRGGTPAEGEIIYLQPKRKKAKTQNHTVRSTDTIRSISQEYAVKISNICKLNGLSENSPLSPGMVLKLR